jgi:hypothetical protein
MERWEDVGWNAEQLAKRGSVAEAEAHARSIPSAPGHTGYSHAKVWAFIEIGRTLLAAGRQHEGIKILSEAEQMARMLRSGGTWEEAYALGAIGDVWRNAGNAGETLRLWRAAVAASQVGPTDTLKLLARIAQGLRSMGLDGEALEVAKLLPQGYPWGALPE